MARICVAGHAGGKDTGHRYSRWLDVDVDAAAVLQGQIAELLSQDAGEGEKAWTVLAYEGVPDFGPHPDLDELLAYLDAVDEYGAPFEAWWSTQSFDHVIQAADAFADSYQGTYVDIAGWAYHYLSLMGERIEAGRDLEAYGRTAVRPTARCDLSTQEEVAPMCSGMTETP